MRDTYPYCPPDFRQNPFMIAGRQNIDGINRVATDCRIPPANGMTHDIKVIPFPNVSVSKIDSISVAGFRPISGRGAGPGLFDLMAFSVANIGKTGEAEK